ncbi:MAG: kynureninase [Proteobacteria bacterium]|nr:MAG: kynureninase [Pseudomonadota bacterium]
MFQPDEEYARHLDAADPLTRFRDAFHLPRRADGTPALYFCTHSLGLLPKAAQSFVDQEIRRWADLGVDGHFQGDPPWYIYQESMRPVLAGLIGARPSEVILMNGLTVNLHLMLETFYRPSAERPAILLDAPPFPSDLYAVKSQLARHGHDPSRTLRMIRPRPGEDSVRIEDIEEWLETHGHEVATVVWNPVNFLTGQFLDVPRLVAAARRQGCVVGLDLAHAAGNVPLALHDWGVDFAVWCNYKYLCGGPGALAGCFVHETHGKKTSLPRLAGWWGNDPSLRFRMQLEPEFQARPGADGWQISNPPVLAMAPLRASLAVFDEAGLPNLRQRSQKLTGYLEYLLDRLPHHRIEVMTPRDPERRGCQLSLRVRDGAREMLKALADEGVVADFRELDVIRLAPAPLYNTFREVWSLAQLILRLQG